MTDNIKALIVDDSAVVRRGVRTLLELDGGIDIVGEADDGEVGLALAAQTQPDIVLLDVRMPRRDGLSIVAELSRSARVLMLTFSDDSHVVRQAMSAGATGYLVHGTFDADSLAATVRSAAAGMAALSGPAISAMMGGGGTDEPHPDKAEKWALSARQAEVMDLISQGRTNREIAKELFLTEKTVKNHINQIFTKLNAGNRGQAIAAWLGTAPSTSA